MRTEKVFLVVGLGAVSTALIAVSITLLNCAR